MLPVGDPDEGGEVAGVFGDVLDVNPLTAGAAVSAVVQGIGQQAGGAELLRDVVVAAGMFAEPAPPVDRPNLSKDYLAGNAPEEWVPLRPAAISPTTPSICGSALR